MKVNHPIYGNIIYGSDSEQALLYYYEISPKYSWKLYCAGNWPVCQRGKELIKITLGSGNSD